MTSVMEKSQSQKRSFFFRSSSIEKLKCTAVYPFQIAGVKLSKDAIIELLESNIIKARIATQKAQISFYIAALKLLSTLLSSVVGASMADPKTDICAKNNATTTEVRTSESSKTFHERLHEKLNKLQTHKNRVHINETVGDRDETTAAAENLDLSQPLSSTLVRQSELELNKNYLLCPKENTAQKKFEKVCFMLCVHLGLVFMYLQILILAIALNTTSIPVGLVFMIATAGFIGYIIFKIFFVEKSNKDKSRKASKGTENQKCNSLLKDVSSERQSRQKFKKVIPVIDFNSKTLSKVKLL